MVVSAAPSPRVGRGVALGRLYSPGSMAGALWRTTGLTPPLVKFPIPDDRSLGHWIEAAHGGWVTAELTGALLPVADADVRSAHPAAWSLAGWWTVLQAASAEETDVAAEVRALCHRAATGDLGVVLERANYPTLGRTICAVRPAGEPWPTERPQTGGARLVVAPVEGGTLHMTAADAVAASYLARKPARLTWARRLDPIGQEEAQPVRLRDDVVVPAGIDPIPALVRLRPGKGGDERLRALVRVIANAATPGVFARLDQDRSRGRLVERPATWTWPPPAAGVPAIARMWLAAVERGVTDRGGAIVTRDTDGVAAVSLPEGGVVGLSDGRKFQALSWDEVEGILGSFDRLDPFGDGSNFWSLEQGTQHHPLHVLALAPKRYVKAQANNEGGWDVVGGTEHALGGGLIDPPAMAGRGVDRRHRWALPVAAHALDRMLSEEPRPFESPWERSGTDPFPALARWSAGSPAALSRVPVSLGAHAFAPLIEARVDRLLAPGASAPLALDPGDDLAAWADLDWRDATGRRVHLSTGDDPGASVPLARLADVAADWSVPVAPKDPSLLTFDRRLARRVGRGGGLIDARLADPGAVAVDHQALYSEGDATSFVTELAQSLGKRAFARRFGVPLKTAERLALGRRPSSRTVRRVISTLGHEATARPCALVGCEAPVARPNARFCSKTHADRAYRSRRTTRRAAARSDPFAGVPVCTCCGALMVGAADTGTGLCADCAEGKSP